MEDVLSARQRLSDALSSSGPVLVSAVDVAPQVELQLDASAVPSGVAAATVAWRHPTVPSPGDALALYCNTASSVADLIDYRVLTMPSSSSSSSSSNSSSSSSSGSGSDSYGAFATHLPALAGCDYVVRYLTGAARLLTGAAAEQQVQAQVAVVAASAPLTLLQADTDPVGTRLAVGDGPGDVLFTWTSLNATAEAYVLVGTTPGGPYTLRFSSQGAAPVTYTAADTCHAPANQTGITSYIFPGYFHTVAVTGLNTSSQYYAVYGQEGGSGVAPELAFRTRPQPGPDVPVRFAAFGDSATYPVFPGTVTTIDMVLAQHAEAPLDFTTVIGDLGYAEGSTLVWALWTGFVWPVASAMPFQVTVGNHEVNTDYCSAGASPIAQQSGWVGPAPAVNAYGDDSGGEAGVATYARYRAPPSSTGHGVFWYSFDVGSVHFILLSSEHDYTAGSAQRAWLVGDLGAVDRTVTPWLVVGLHRPVYNGYNDSDWSIAVAGAAQLEPLFLQYGVDLVLAGHYHNYLRTASVANYTVDPTGSAPVYITVGTGGATYHNETVRPDAASWTVATDAEWGYGLVEAFNRSALRWSFRSNVEGGAAVDEAWILRPHRLQ